MSGLRLAKPDAPSLSLAFLGLVPKVRAAEAAEDRARTPIVALSANALTHQVQEYLGAGMDAHVPKPIELEKLQAVLEQVLLGEASSAAA